MEIPRNCEAIDPAWERVRFAGRQIFQLKEIGGPGLAFYDRPSLLTVHTTEKLCPTCLKATEKMNPGYYGSLSNRSRPFYLFTSIEELIHVAKRGRLTAAFAKGRKPEEEGWHFCKISISLEQLKTCTADELREFVHERLISELPPGYHTEHCVVKKDAPLGAPWADDEATAT